MQRANHQRAPHPDELAALIASVTYKDRCTFTLEEDLDRGQGSRGMTLVIQITTPDSYHHERTRSVNHYFPVPPAAYDMRSWQHWLFEQILLVERHEACEFFTIDGVKPYAPHHQPGADPYAVIEIGTPEEADTDFRGRRVHPTSTE